MSRTKLLKGSCHCRAVTFSVRSSETVPYQRCYCAICRKTQGGGGYAINLGARADTLSIRGERHVKTYRAKFKNPEDARAHRSTAERSFCGECGSGLWLFSPEWPDLIHPFASAIDTKLPTPPAHVHLMLDFRASWCEVQGTRKDGRFDRYPDESLRAWHDRHRL